MPEPDTAKLYSDALQKAHAARLRDERKTMRELAHIKQRVVTRAEAREEIRNRSEALRAQQRNDALRAKQQAAPARRDPPKIESTEAKFEPRPLTLGGGGGSGPGAGVSPSSGAPHRFVILESGGLAAYNIAATLTT